MRYDLEGNIVPVYIRKPVRRAATAVIATAMVAAPAANAAPIHHKPRRPRWGAVLSFPRPQGQPVRVLPPRTINH
jgi:hypothetical protein